MTKSLSDGREMLTAEQVHELTGVPVSTLHDWAAKRERGIDAPGPTTSGSVIAIAVGHGAMSTSGSNPPESDMHTGELRHGELWRLWIDPAFIHRLTRSPHCVGGRPHNGRVRAAPACSRCRGSHWGRTHDDKAA